MAYTLEDFEDEVLGKFSVCDAGHADDQKGRSYAFGRMAAAIRIHVTNYMTPLSSDGEHESRLARAIRMKKAGTSSMSWEGVGRVFTEEYPRILKDVRSIYAYCLGCGVVPTTQTDRAAETTVCDSAAAIDQLVATLGDERDSMVITGTRSVRAYVTGGDPGFEEAFDTGFRETRQAYVALKQEAEPTPTESFGAV